MKKLMIVLLLAIAGSAFALPVLAAGEVKVLADWQFNRSGTSGEIADGSLSVTDRSGNGNDLVMRTYGEKFADTLSFSDESLDGESGSLFFNGDSVNKVGADFVTGFDAPINKDKFERGYTIEIVYRMPEDWTVADRWTSLISRLGNGATFDTEGETITSSFNVSNCKEVQVCATEMNGKKAMGSDGWSVSMDNGDMWYHIVIAGGTGEIRTYINGCEAFRDHYDPEFIGLFADPEDGRFRIFNRVKEGVPYRFTRGYLQRIRISEGVLDRADWIYPEPEKLLGEYGSNEPYPFPSRKQYTFALLPDTQNTVKFKPEIMNAAVDYMIENAGKLNLKAVISLGDNVQDWDDPRQWENAEAAFNRLPEAGISLFEQPGNHDYGENFYLDSFGPESEFARLSKGVWVCDSPSGYSSYMTVQAGSYTYLIVSLAMYQLYDEAEREWFRNVLDTHKDMPAIVTSHDLLSCSPVAPSAVQLDDRGNQLFDIIKDYDNVFMLWAGHNHGSGMTVAENAHGLPVYCLLADYQFAYNGGNAFFKFMQVDEEAGEITVRTFSPYAAGLEPESKGFFDVNFMVGEGNNTTIKLDFSRFATDKGAQSLIDSGILVGDGTDLRLDDLITDDEFAALWAKALAKKNGAVITVPEAVHWAEPYHEYLEASGVKNNDVWKAAERRLANGMTRREAANLVAAQVKGV